MIDPHDIADLTAALAPYGLRIASVQCGVHTTFAIDGDGPIDEVRHMPTQTVEPWLAMVRDDGPRAVRHGFFGATALRAIQRALASVRRA